MATSMAPRGTLTADEQGASVRLVGIVAAVAAAAVYLTIGFGFVSVGTTADGDAPGMLEFGILSAAMMLAVAGALWRLRSRLVWLGIAVLQVLVIVFYVAVASIRQPPFEAWGLLIKVCQLVVLGAAAWLALRGGGAAHDFPRHR
jgi:hypothetical protein